MAIEMIKIWPEDAIKFISETLAEKAEGFSVSHRSVPLSPQAARAARCDSGVRGVFIRFDNETDPGDPYIGPYATIMPAHLRIMSIISGQPHAALETYAETKSGGIVETVLTVYNPEVQYGSAENFPGWRSQFDIWK